MDRNTEFIAALKKLDAPDIETANAINDAIHAIEQSINADDAADRFNKLLAAKRELRNK